MAKIFSILTLIVAGVAIWLGFESQKLVDTLQKKGEAQYQDLLRTRIKLKQTEEKLAETERILAETKADLEQTREKLRTTEEELAKTKTELQTTKAELETKNGELAEIKKAIEEVLPGGDLTEGIRGLKSKITELVTKTKEQEAAIVQLEKDKAGLESKVASLTDIITGNEKKIANQGVVIKKHVENIMQKGIQGRVMAVNSGWGFCIVSIGDKAGAANNKVLVVARNGRAIGRLKITNIEATQSVADIIPGTFLKGMTVQPGDAVIYTGEDKVVLDDEVAKNAGVVVPPPLPQP